MVTDLPVIVSSGRYNDIGPYSAIIYAQEPKVWGSVFPWEFPQDASREIEEHFLREFFSDTDIHLQGGADGDGNGFKFLKQVWYCNALWNLHERIPAVAKWWEQQPDNINSLQDPALRKWFFVEGVKPSTFFNEPELKMYGAKFLTYVIPLIQYNAKRLEDQKQGDTESVASTIVEGVVTNEQVSGGPPPASKELPMLQSSNQQPTLPNAATENASRPKQREPSSWTSSDDARPRMFSHEYSMPYDGQPQSRKRGNSGGRRHSRVGHYQPRQTSHFNERTNNACQPQVYGPLPPQGYAPAVWPFNSPGTYIQPVPQGHLPPGLSSPTLPYPPAHQGPPGLMQYAPIPPNGTFMPGAQQGPFVNPFGNRHNDHVTERTLSGDYNKPQDLMDPYSFRRRSEHRRDSFGTRGGKARGQSGYKGRGSRGRNSFSTADHAPAFGMQNKYNSSNALNDGSGTGFVSRDRRGSIIEERSWRSGSDYPQAQPDMQVKKENALPAYPSATQNDQPAPGSQQAEAPKSSNRPQEQVEHVFSPSTLASRPGIAGQALGDGDKHKSAAVQPFNAEQGCTQNYIGVRCAYANKLVAFDISMNASEESLYDFFGSFGMIRQVEKKYPSSKNSDSRLAFATFVDAHNARRCMLTKPSHWPDGRPLRVEVAKEFWDPLQQKFDASLYIPGYKVAELLGQSKAVTHEKPDIAGSAVIKTSQDIPAAPRDQVVDSSLATETHSADTTPTASGASTPRKAKRKNPPKKKKKEPDLRKTSLAATFDSSRQDTFPDDNDDNASMVTAFKTDPGAFVTGDVSAEPESSTTTALVPTQYLDTSVAEMSMRTTSEPSFSPTDVIATQLPARGLVPTNIAEPQRQSEASQKEHQQSGSAESVSDLEKTAEKIDSFRETQKTAEKAKSVATSDTGKAKGNEKSKETITNAATPGQSEGDGVDDSFYTASGSPHSNKVLKSDNVDVDYKKEARHAEDVGALADTKARGSSAEPVSKLRTEEPPASAKEGKKVTVDEKAMTSVVARVPSSMASKPESLVPTVRSVSEGTEVPPTPAFFTAPNTPAIPQEFTDLSEAEHEIEPAQSTKDGKAEEEKAEKEKAEKEKAEMEKAEKERAENAKGPAQTESFSLFGKRKEKPQKKGKKGTIKGKPKPDSANVTSGETSRTVSVAATPGNDAISDGAKAAVDTKNAREDTDPAESKVLQTPRKAGKSGKATKDRDANEPAAEPAIEQETPRKHKGLGDYLSGLSGYFGGGQQSQSAPPSSKTSLTGDKAQDLLQEAENAQVHPETNTADPAADVGATDAAATLVDTPIADKATGDRPSTIDDEHTEQTNGAQAPAADVGLGITTGAEASAGEEEQPKKKPKKKKPKKKKNKTKDDSTPATPVAENEGAANMYRFGQGSAPPNAAGDDRSETSSHTMGRETPVSETPSPVVPTSSKKLPLRPSGSGHIVQEKTKSWKLKNKRVGRDTDTKASEPDDEVEMTADDDNIMYILNGQQNNSDGSRQTSPSDAGAPGTDQQKKLLIYVGPGLREEQAEGEESAMSKKKIQKLAKEEIKKRHGENTSSSSD